VAGAAQPELWGDAGLIRAAKQLLPVKPVVQPGRQAWMWPGGGPGPGQPAFAVVTIQARIRASSRQAS
jgi:hypothetical protein